MDVVTAIEEGPKEGAAKLKDQEDRLTQAKRENQAAKLMLEVQIPHDEEILKTPVLFLSSSLFLLLPFLLLWPDIAYLRGRKIWP